MARVRSADEPLAAIDIGTNSIHLVVARPTGNSRFEVLDREKEVVRLGSGSGDMKRLAPDAIDRGVAALRRFRQMAASRDAEICAVATSAVREAENRRRVPRARRTTRRASQVDVISGAEEARLIHLGVLQAVPVFDQRHLLVDIGGGSTEFVIGEGGEVLEARSLKLGAIRMTERFFSTARSTRTTVERVPAVHPLLPRAGRRDGRQVGFEVAVGSSGTIVNLVRGRCAPRGEPPLRQLSGATFSRREARRRWSTLLLAAATVDERAAIAGLDPKRADIIARRRARARARRSRARHRRDGRVRLRAARRRAARRAAAARRHVDRSPRRPALRERDAPRRDRSRRDASTPSVSTELALRAVRADSASVHGLDAPHEEILEAAGLLANVGLFVSHDRAPPAQLLRDPQLRTAHGVHRPRDRADRAGRPLPPQERAEAEPRRSSPLLTPDDAARRAVLAGILRIAHRARPHADRRRAERRRRGAATTSITIVPEGDGDIDARAVHRRRRARALLEDALGVEVVIA